MSSSLVKCFFILAALAAACNAPEKEEVGTQAAPGSADADPSVMHHPEPPSRPSEKRDSIRLEGNYHQFTARLVESQGEPRFSTYIPADMLYEPSSSDEGDGHFFFANFAGQRNDRAFLLVFIYPAGTDEARARAGVNALVASLDTIRGRTMRDTSYVNSLYERAFFFRRDGGTHFGKVALTRHGNRFVHVLTQYPQEFGDGFSPRASYISRQWAWLDDGQGLGLTSPPPPGSPR